MKEKLKEHQESLLHWFRYGRWFRCGTKEKAGLIFQEPNRNQDKGMDKDLGSYKKLADQLADIKTQLDR